MITITRIIWVALWNTQLFQETENFNKSAKKNSTCVIDIENLALGFLHNCQEIDTDRFRILFYLSLSYILGEILLLIGIDVIGRKIFLGKRIVSIPFILTLLYY